MAFGPRPNGPFGVNWDSPQAQGLREWYPLSPMFLPMLEFINRSWVTSLPATAPSLSPAYGGRDVPGAINFASASAFKWTGRPAKDYAGLPLTIMARVFKPTTIPIGSAFSIGAPADADDALYLRIASANAKYTAARTYVSGKTTSTKSRSGANNTIIPDVWTHIAATDPGATALGTEWLIYRNGLDDTSGSTTSDGTGTAYATTGSRFPASAATSNQYTGGLIDVRIYDRVLTPALMYEIAVVAPTDLYWVPSNRKYFIGSTGTAYTQSLGGGFTPAGAITKAGSHAKGGGFTPVGAIIKAASQANGGSVTPAGLAAHAALTVKDGNVVSAGIVAKAATQGKGGSMMPAGQPMNAGNKEFGGSLVPGGAITQAAVQQKGGTIGGAGSLTRAVAKSLGGAITPSSIITQLTTFVRSLGGSIAPAGALARGIDQGKAGAIALSGALKHDASRGSGGVIAPSGQVAPQVAKSVGGLVGLTGVVIRDMRLTLGGALQATGHALQAASQSLSGSIAAVGALSRGVARVLSGVLNWIGSILNHVSAVIVPRTIDVVGSYQTTVDTSGSYEPTVDAIGSYEPKATAGDETEG